MLETQGFEVEIQDSIYNDTASPAAVLRQFPDADALVKVNRTVYLTINRAIPPVIDMPNLEGLSFRSLKGQTATIYALAAIIGSVEWVAVSDWIMNDLVI